MSQGSSAFQGLKGVLKHYQLEDKGGYITQEFQDYGYRIAMTLDDVSHKSIYIKLAKHLPRGILEAALRYVSDAQAKSKARLFMWKVKQLRTEIGSSKVASTTSIKTRKKQPSTQKKGLKSSPSTHQLSFLE